MTYHFSCDHFIGSILNGFWLFYEWTKIIVWRKFPTWWKVQHYFLGCQKKKNNSHYESFAGTLTQSTSKSALSIEIGNEINEKKKILYAKQLTHAQQIHSQTNKAYTIYLVHCTEELTNTLTLLHTNMLTYYLKMQKDSNQTNYQNFDYFAHKISSHTSLINTSIAQMNGAIFTVNFFQMITNVKWTKCWCRKIWF